MAQLQTAGGAGHREAVGSEACLEASAQRETGRREGGGLVEPDPPTPAQPGEGRYPDRVQHSWRVKGPLRPTRDHEWQH
jgi:hypothetical protein